MSKQNKRKTKTSPARVIIVILALLVFSYAAYRLYLILNDYHKSDTEYSSLRDEYATPKATPVSADTGLDTIPKYEDADPPLALDWDALKAINKDIVGWVYVDAEPTISYPICWRKEDDSYYLHRSFKGQYVYAGSIFLEGLNNPDFSDPLSIVYGHNMKNGSMFAMLKNLLNQEEYDANPYFWILTPQGDYRYHIFSVLQTEKRSSVYTLFSESGGEFLEYEKNMQKSSAVKNSVPLFDDDKCVLLSTCTSDGSHRTVVLGRCCSTKQPVKTTDGPAVKTKNRVVITPTPEAEKREEEPQQSSLQKLVNSLFGEV